ncbi:MATE family efflux transporter [Erysipelothrix urinaevulpis]|uniref:MATE family efflux transporter n=1 Tax=Erysipelothrix urinaevulpis TaxID=2683717 RepID=UPI00135B3B36|nr:MATE family efflux transporter [Erysipelothrix urinaevulpis]
MILKRYFGDRDFFKTTFMIAIPLMLQQVVSTAVNLLDNLMIGQLGDHSLAGVAAVNRYFMIALFGTMGVIAAASVFMAQFYGSDDRHHMQQTFRYSILSTCLIMSIFIIIALLFPQEIISFFVKDPHVIREGSRYIVISALSFIPTMFTMAIAGAMRATGDSKTPLIASVASMVTNLVFNYALIYGHFGFPAMGVVGAGIGTLIARLVEVTIISFALRRGDYIFKSSVNELFNISPTLIKAITLKSLPLSINEVMFAMGMALLLRFYGTRGADVISGYSIAVTVSDLFFTMNAGMSIAATILVSQPLGANNLQKAKENGYHLLGFGFILASIFGVMLFMTSFIVPNLYNVSATAIHLATNFLRIQAFLFWIYVLNTTVYFILRAGGDTKSTLMMDSGYMWCVNLVCVGIATYYTNLNVIGLYLIGQSTDVLKMIISITFLHKEKWLVNLAEKETEQELLLD